MKPAAAAVATGGEQQGDTGEKVYSHAQPAGVIAACMAGSAMCNQLTQQPPLTVVVRVHHRRVEHTVDVEHA